MALAEAGLIDEYELIVHPRIAGHGPTLLAGLSQHLDLELVDQTPGRASAANGCFRGIVHRPFLADFANYAAHQKVCCRRCSGRYPWAAASR